MNVAAVVAAYAVERPELRTVRWAIGDLADRVTGEREFDRASTLSLDNEERVAWFARNVGKLDLPNSLRPICHRVPKRQADGTTRMHTYLSMYGRLNGEFFGTPAARAARVYYAEALLGQGRWADAGAAYGWATAALLSETGARDSAGRAAAEQAARNAVVAYDSAVARSPADRAVQDLSLIHI